MEYLLKVKREKIEAEADKLFGNDILLKTAYVMSKMEYSKEEQEEVIELLRKEAMDLAKEIEAKMVYTFDASGNVVPINPEQDSIEINISA